MKAKTHLEYLQELKDSNIEIIPLEEYVGATTKILHKCICGNEWYASPNNILRGRKCPECKRMKLHEQHIMSHKEFIDKYQDQFNKSIKVVGQYINSKSKIECTCLKCGAQILMFPDALIRGAGCKYCASKEKGNKYRKTHEQFLSELYSINSSIKILSKYTGALSPIKCCCKKCGYQWDAIPSNLLKGSGCSRCAKNLKYSDEEFREKVFEGNPNIELHSKYINNKSRIECSCRICNHIWFTTAGCLLQGTGCPKCAINKNADKQRFTHEQFINKYSNSFNPQIKILGKYVNMSTSIECKCLECKRIFFTMPYRIASGSGCDSCSRARVGLRSKKTFEEYQLQLKEVNPDIILLSEYNGAREYISCKCKICGGEWSTVAGVLISTKHTGCPYCNQSHGEKEIERILKKYSIVYDIQKEFEGLYGVKKGNLSYDFYLPTYNLLIEYQGEQHERPIEGYVDEKEYKKQLEHDRRKRQYAIDNSINLLEIWYYDFDRIENILKIYLNLESVETVTES